MFVCFLIFSSMRLYPVQLLRIENGRWTVRPSDDHTDLVAALGDINTDNEHNIHLNIDLQTVLMVL